jgi:peptidoglycan/xylan/chitin deacetylase (PgdA/CDA1 family)
MGMKDGDIILMHDGKPQTLAALPTIINRYYAQGLCFGDLARTVTERKAENGKYYAVHAVAP